MELSTRPLLSRWSVWIRTEGDRIVEREEVVALADAIAVFSGIASGVEQPGYGAQIVVVARSRAEALKAGLEIFDNAVTVAGLPPFPIVHADATSEREEAELSY